MAYLATLAAVLVGMGGRTLLEKLLEGLLLVGSISGGLGVRNFCSNFLLIFLRASRDGISAFGSIEISNTLLRQEISCCTSLISSMIASRMK